MVALHLERISVTPLWQLLPAGRPPQDLGGALLGGLDLKRIRDRPTYPRFCVDD